MAQLALLQLQGAWRGGIAFVLACYPETAAQQRVQCKAEVLICRNCGAFPLPRPPPAVTQGVVGAILGH